MLYFLGNFVNPVLEDQNIRFESNRLLIVDDEGFITHYDDATTQASRDLLQSASDVIELGSEEFILPSFVDTHFHCPQYFNLGIGYDKPLLEWLEAYTFPAESNIDVDPEGLGKVVYTTLVKRFIQEGITLVAAYGTQSVEANMVLARAFQEAGIRGLIGKVCQDINSPANYCEQTSDSLDKMARFIDEMQKYSSSFPETKRLVQPVITPRFLPTCSEALMRGLAKMSSETGIMMQTHMLEGADEKAFSEKLWNGRSELDIFTDLGYMNDRTLMAHCTHVDPRTLQAMVDKGVSIAHCPVSNAYFSERPFPLREALDLHAKVGLGADVSGGHRFSSQEVMRGAVISGKGRQHRAVDGLQDQFNVMAGKDSKDLSISWRESIYVATLGGARAVKMDKIVGSFQVGKQFDAQVISLGGADSMIDLFLPQRSKSLSFEELVEKWWCNGTPTERKSVYVCGAKLK